MAATRKGTSGAGVVGTGTYNTLPAGIAAGDALVKYVISDSSALLTATLSGWARIAQGSGAGLYWAVFRRDAAGAETGNIQLTGLTGGTKGVSWIDVFTPSSGATITVDAQAAADTDASSTAVAMAGSSWALAIGDWVDCAAYVYATSAFSGNLGTPVLAPGVAATVTARFGGRTSVGGTANLAAYASQDAQATAAATAAPSFSATSAGANGQGLVIFARIRESVVTATVSASVAGSPAHIAGNGQPPEAFTVTVSVAGGTATAYGLRVERSSVADFSSGVTVVADGTARQAGNVFTITPDVVAYWRFKPYADLA